MVDGGIYHHVAGYGVQTYASNTTVRNAHIHHVCGLATVHVTTKENLRIENEEYCHAGSPNYVSPIFNGVSPSPTPSPTPTPTPQPSGSICSQVNQSYGLPQGFGSPMNFFTNPVARIIDTYCNGANRQLWVTKPSSIQYHYTYSTAYQWNTSMNPNQSGLQSPSPAMKLSLQTSGVLPVHKPHSMLPSPTSLHIPAPM